MAGDKKPRLGPTVIVPPIKRVPRATPEAELSKPIRSANGPTKVTGQDRSRISVSMDDLKRLSPGAPRNVFDRATMLINNFNAQTASDRRAMMWGVDVQKSHSDAVNLGLDLSQAPVFAKVEGYVARMLAILQSVDLLPALGISGRSRLFAGVNYRVDTVAELDEARRELDQLSKLMAASLKELMSIKEKLAKNVRDISLIGHEADAHGLAALFLSEHMQQQNPSLADKFAARSLSLGQTYAQIREHGAVQQLHVTRPEQLVELVQQVAMVSLPDFLAAASSILALQSRKSKVSETEAREVDHKLRALIKHINT